MAVSDNLFNAILSMDAYNRGYGAAIGGLPGTGGKLGTATIIAEAGGALEQASGFYAIAYKFPVVADESSPGSPKEATVISYRGTDNLQPDDPSNDIKNGWVIGAGTVTGQVDLAIDFYEEVTGKKITEGAAADTIITGHSLGGGLAGLVSVLSGTKGWGFDYMPFGIVAELIAGQKQITVDWSAFKGIFVQNEVLQFVRNGTAELTLAGLVAVLPAQLQTLIGTGLITLLGIPVSPQSPVFDLLISAAETGILDNKIDKSSLSSFSDDNIFTKLHMQDLLVLLQFAQDNNYSAWHRVAPALWNAYFSDTLATTLGYGSTDPHKIMDRQIAYSALETGERPFGDVAIHALFNDADRIGEVFQLRDYQRLATIDETFKQKLLDTAMEFSGLLAKSDVEFVKNGLATESTLNDVKGAVGVLQLNDSKSVLTVNCSEALWGKAGAVHQSDASLSYIHAFSGWNDVEVRPSITDAMVAAGITESDVQRFHLPITDTNTFTLNEDLLTDASDQSYGLFVTPNSVGATFYVTGTAGNDFIVSGSMDASCSFNAGDGNDILVGGHLADTLISGSGNDVIKGGGGDDSLDCGSGKDFVDGGAGADMLTLDGAFANYQLTTHGKYVGTFTNTLSGSVTSVANVERVLFSDGIFTWDLGLLPGRYLGGTAGSDYYGSVAISTYNTADYIDSGAGDDFIYDPSGGTTTILAGAGNDRIRIFNFDSDKEHRFIDSGYIDGGSGIDTFDSTLADNAFSPWYKPWGSWWETDLTRFQIRNIENFIAWNNTTIGTVEQFESFTRILATDGTSTQTKPFTLVLANSGVADFREELGNAQVHIIGSNFSNTIYAGNGVTELYGGTGNDVLIGGAAADLVNGSSGKDTLIGGAGNDKLYGDLGNDRLAGGLGADELTGGAGKDSFVFDAKIAKNQIDKIMDFSVLDDVILLDHAVFAGLSKPGKLANSQFVKNLSGHAEDKLDRIIYESDTGKLFYDADGTGNAQAVQFASLHKKPALTFHDFIIF